MKVINLQFQNWKRAAALQYYKETEEQFEVINIKKCDKHGP